MTTTAASVESITAPGVYDIPHLDYLADPVPGGSLSNSGAKTLLNATPALFAYQRQNGRPGKRAFDLGHAAHAAVLGAGMEIVAIPEDLLAVNGAASTKAAKEFIAAARARGAVPLSPEDYDTAQAMASALQAHPTAAKLLNPDRGTAEQSLFWIDERSGIWRRARFDLLPHRTAGRMVIVDYKTTDDASPAAFAKTIWNYGYAGQGGWYCDAALALDLAQEATFVLIAQEKSAPYLVSATQLSENALRIGRERNRRAIDLYKKCTEADTWPGYSEDVEVIDVPFWAERKHEEEMAAL